MRRFNRGQIEALRASGQFDAEWYLETYPDVKALGMDPLEHYVWIGARLNRRPSPNSSSLDGDILSVLSSGAANGNAHPAADLRKKIGSAEAAMARQKWPVALELWREILDSTHGNVLLHGRAKTNVSILRRLVNLSQYQRNIEKYRAAVATRKPRIAVFSANVGGYDTQRLPEVVDPNFAYVLFSDRPVADAGIWSVRSIPYSHKDPTRVARYVKTHPHLLLPEFDYAVWLDGNIMIVGDIMPTVSEFMSTGKLMGAVYHPDRRTIYEEMLACSGAGKDDRGVMERQARKYQDAGFVHDDLIESNFLIYNLTDKKTHAFAESWWGEIEKHSKRDQLSLNYALRQHDIEWHPLVERPKSARNHHALAFGAHGKHCDGLASILMKALEGGASGAAPVAKRSRAVPDVSGAKPVAVQFTPKKSANAYYMMLPAALEALGCDIRCTTDWAELMKISDPKKVVHLHQLEPHYHKGDMKASWEAARVLIARLTALHDEGWKIVHTWHNPYPHNRMYLEVDLWVYDQCRRLFDTVIVHLRSATAHVSQFVDRDVIRHIPHPGFTDFYGPRLEKSRARARLSLPDDAFVFMSLGEIKPYKGLDILLGAWERFVESGDADNAVLVLAGRLHDEAYMKSLPNPRNVVRHMRYIPDKEIPAYLSAADAAAYAHKAIWTSGAAILAMSYGLPVIMPRSAKTEEYVVEEDNGFLYAQDDIESLAQTMGKVRNSKWLEHISQMNVFAQKKNSVESAARKLLEIYAA